MTQVLERAIGRQFDRVESRFAPTIRPADVRLRTILRHLGEVRGRRVLDLGCGKGRFLPWLSDRGARVVGLDLSWNMLRAAGRSGSESTETPNDRRPRPLVLGSLTRLPLASGSFDALYGVEVISHLPGLEAAIAELHRVLRPGGKIVLVDKNRWSLHHSRPYLPNLLVKWVDQRRGLWMYPNDFPFREQWFSASGVARLLGRYFVHVQVEHLLSELEDAGPGRQVFRRLPTARHFLLWSASKAEGPRP